MTAGRERHDCPGACGQQVSPFLLACRRCWLFLPWRLRMEVNAAYTGRKVNPDRHRAACAAALDWYRRRQQYRRTVTGPRPGEVTP